ncbi:MAG: bifunctional DNA-formamidopyrimidine glycosylase/DNA-(apurinic or apyrimidinic site) lyase [Mycoplasmatales bacterium]
MPELPEVETVKKILSGLVIGKKIRDIDVRCEKMIKNTDPKLFIDTIVGQKITNIRRYGKYLFFDFENNTVVSHLRMEGKYNYYDTDMEPSKHDHVIFWFDDNSVLMYNDTRKFGTMELVGLKQEMSLKSVNKLGIEPYSNELTLEYLKSKIKGRSITIKQFLLDQTIITGLGNIYVDEVLFAAYVHPCTKVNKLTDDNLKEIIKYSNSIINMAIKGGGTTIKSFSVSGGKDGNFQHQIRMYGHAGETCDRCLTMIEKIKVGGRGTCFCPKCQVEKWL